MIEDFEDVKKANANLEKMLKDSLGRIEILWDLSDKQKYKDNPWTFSNCGQEGNTGPSLDKCIQHYKMKPGYNLWIGINQELLTMNNNYPGIQIWEVPITGTYQIDAYGADAKAGSLGYQGGAGAVISGRFRLTKSQEIEILVGQRPYPYPLEYNGCGAGGTFVVSNSRFPIPSQDILLVAGGGGGGTPPPATSKISLLRIRNRE